MQTIVTLSYAVLGNHDYDDGRDLSRGAHQVAYGQQNPKWILPDDHYTFEAGDALFLALNTEWIVRAVNDSAAVQAAMVDAALGATAKPWVIALGHHPYRSNGANGDAVESLKNFLEERVCPRADLYLAGHDHNLQILAPPGSCRTLLVVSGGGGYETYSLREANPAHCQFQSLGFAYVTVTQGKLSVQLYDADGRLLGGHQLLK